MPPLVSTLDDQCDAHVGRVLVVEPHYSHGWQHEGGDWGVPEPFSVRLVRIYSYQGERRGVVARIEQPGYMYDGFWLVSATRHLGIWNFTDAPARYNLSLCPEEPVLGTIEDSPDDRRYWPIWHLQGHPQASGYGRIAESLECGARYDERTADPNDHSNFRFVGMLIASRDQMKHCE